MKRSLIVLLCLTLFFQVGCTQQTDKTKVIDKARLDQYFQALDQHQKFMGSVAIAKDGQTVYTKSIGFSDVEKQIKSDEHTQYRIGSISKTFTTVLVFKAVEENKLSLDQNIAEYFPSIPHADKITIGLLLSHRSGIHNFTDAPDYLSWNTQPKSESEMADIIAKGGSDFEPDTKAAYSNSNFVLLTYILEKTFKKPFAEILNEKIIKPTGLKHTHFGGKIDPAQHDAYSYKFNEHWVKEPETDMSVPLGAGAMVSTPSDLTRFADALFSDKLISAKYMKQMETLKDNFGMGLFMIPFYDKQGYGHTGGIDGFSSVFVYFPQEKVAAAITSNGSNYAINNILIVLLNGVYNKTIDIPDFKTYAVSPEELDQYTGTYSSKDLPLKITVSKSGNSLTAQATGQSAFTLEASAKDKFQFDPAGIIMEFKPGEKQMILRQGGANYNYTKD